MRQEGLQNAGQWRHYLGWRTDLPCSETRGMTSSGFLLFLRTNPGLLPFPTEYAAEFRQYRRCANAFANNPPENDAARPITPHTNRHAFAALTIAQRCFLKGSPVSLG